MAGNIGKLKNPPGFLFIIPILRFFKYKVVMPFQKFKNVDIQRDRNFVYF